MSEWFSQYWYLVIVLLIVLAATVFGMVKASDAYKKHNKLFHEEEEKIKRLTELKQKFVPLTKEAIDTGSDQDLLEGVALAYQLKIQKEIDMTAAFEKLPIEVRYIYTLDIFVSEGAVVSGFYRNNGRELKSLIVPAMKAIGENSAAEICGVLYAMFDEDSEVSVDRALIAETDEKFATVFDAESFKLSAAKYVRVNRDKLIGSYTDNF